MQATEFVKSYFDAWNHWDSEAVADHLAADGIYCDIPENVRRSHDELAVSLNEFFASTRHRYELIGDILQGTETIAFQYCMYPVVQVRKAARENAVRGAEFITLNGDEALTIYDYYDFPGSSAPSELARFTAQHAAKAKYAKSGLNDDQLHAYQRRLEQIMQQGQVYLRSDLTLPELARAVNCSVNHLSQVINAGCGVSFFDYLNKFRVEHAKILLSQLDSQNSAVLNIAFSVGFNSNSAFYAAFKKCVGQTPAQFRRAQLK